MNALALIHLNEDDNNFQPDKPFPEGSTTFTYKQTKNSKGQETKISALYSIGSIVINLIGHTLYVYKHNAYDIECHKLAESLLRAGVQIESLSTNE